MSWLRSLFRLSIDAPCVSFPFHRSLPLGWSQATEQGSTAVPRVRFYPGGGCRPAPPLDAPVNETCAHLLFFLPALQVKLVFSKRPSKPLAPPAARAAGRRRGRGGRGLAVRAAGRAARAAARRCPAAAARRGAHGGAHAPVLLSPTERGRPAITHKPHAEQRTMQRLL